MTRPQGWLALILALAIGSLLLLRTLPLSLGLDLRGGSQLTLLVKPAGDITRVEAKQLEAVKEVLERRVNGLGVSEATVTTSGSDRIVVQLPGVQDPRRAAEVLGTTARLEFRAQKPDTQQELTNLTRLKRLISARQDQISGRNQTSSDEAAPDVSGPLTELLQQQGIEVPANATEEEQLEALLVETERRITPLFGEPELTGSDLVDAGRQQQQGSQSWEVTLRFSQAGGEKFADLTKSIAGTNRLLGIMLDGRSISEASVGPQFATAGITGGAATITGRFTADQARDLEVQLRGGALPLPVEIIENRSVGPTLGAQNIRNSLIAAGSGTALVGVFMVIIYRLPGAVALLALLLYSLFNLALYALIPVTLTLPGIAGFILSVGMAVDANILILREVKRSYATATPCFVQWIRASPGRSHRFLMATSPP